MEKINPNPKPFTRENRNKMTKFGWYAYCAYYRGGYIGLIIPGGFGTGKSTTAIHLGREICQAVYGVNEFQGYQLALQNMLFTMEDVIEATDSLGKIDEWEDIDPMKAIKQSAAIRTPVLIWDDAGMHGSKYKHFMDMDDAYELQSNFDTIRDVTSCMIITVPEDDELLKFLRNYRGNYTGEIININGEYLRKMEFWKYGKDRLGRKKKKLRWTSKEYSIHVENYYYGMYKKMKNIAKITNAERYKKKRKMKEAKQKYYETKQKYYQLKMEKEMQELITN